MDSNTKYPSDSELNRSNVKSEEIEWKRRRNNSAENCLILDSGLRSGLVTRKLDEVNESKNMINSSLSIEAIKAIFQSNLTRDEPNIRNKNRTSELACCSRLKIVDTDHEASTSQEYPLNVTKNPSSDELKIETPSTSEFQRISQIDYSRDSLDPRCMIKIDDLDLSNTEVNTEKSHIRNEYKTTELARNAQHTKVGDTDREASTSKESEIETSEPSGLQRKADFTSSCETSKLHLDSCDGLSLDSGKNSSTKDVDYDFARSSQDPPVENAGVAIDVSELSATESKISATQSQDLIMNELSVATSKASVFQTENTSHLEDDCSGESCNLDFWDGFRHECCKTSSTEVGFTQTSVENVATNASKIQPLQSLADAASINDLDQIKGSFSEKHTIQKSSDNVSAHGKEISSMTEIPSGNSKAGTGSPYQILEGKSTLGETIIGQPRCLTLKQYNANLLDYDLDFDFEFTDDIEDDLPLKEQHSGTGENETKQRPNPNDMFLDDDSEVTEVQNIPYINLASPSFSGRNRESSNLEKEEGELTPELHSTTQTDHGESKDANSKKSNTKESNLEFFSKVNRCFFQLDKEFNNIRVPRESKKLIGHLQDTLRIVKRMDRKLSLLIESVNNRGERDRKHLKHGEGAASGSSRNLKGASKDNLFKNVFSSTKDAKKVNERFDSRNLRSTEQNKRHGDNYQDSKLDKSLESTRVNDGRHGTNSNVWWCKESQTTHDKNASRKVYPSETKKEKQRIQSLFKRQMSLITRHVVQKNKTFNRQCVKSGALGKSSEDKLTHDDAAQNIKVHDITQKLPNLDEIKTLEDMEAFFQTLKEKRLQKSANQEDGVIDYKENHGVLKFTTKKNKHTKWRSFLENATTATKNKMAVPMVLSTKIGDNVSFSKENPSENSKETIENEKIIDKEVSKSRKELDGKNSQDEQLVNYNSNNPFKAIGSEIANLSRSRNSKEQRHVKSTMKRENLGSFHRDRSVEGIELQNGEVNDSFLVKRNSKEMECIEPISERKVSYFESDSQEKKPKNSKKRMTKKRKHPKPKSSESDSQRELKDQIPKKRKRARPRSKLSSSEPKNDTPSISKSQSRSRYHSDSEEGIDYSDDHLPSELKPKNLFILADKNLPLLDKHFSLKVKGNQIFLQTKGKSRSNKYKREFKSSDEEIPRKRTRSGKTDKQPHFDPQDAGTTLKEMEDFLQQLRSKKKVAIDEQQEQLPPNLQTREAKFMARIQAKRKAKLMACMSETPTITEKEAKFLKDLENRAREPCDSPETMRKKQKLMQKIRAETDAIVLAQKQSQAKNSNPEEDPLSDVKTILNMIREAESGSDANSRQFLVSFPLKRSDVKQLESITTGKTPALSEESQRFLNSVRAKMRAKKTAVNVEGSEQKQLQKDLG